MIPLDELAGRVTFIAGSAKNAGKTTLLVYLLRLLRGSGALCFGSAGLDGEQTCAVTGEEKPSVTCLPGDLVITSSRAVEESRGNFEILEVFPWHTGMGRTVLVRTLREGSLELVRPETNSRLGIVLETARALYPDLTVLVDGAAGRLTQSASVLRAGYLYTALMNPSNVEKVSRRIRLLGLLDRLPEWRDETEEAVMIPGALTGKTILPEGTEPVVLEDHGRVFMTCREFEKLTASRRVYTRRKIPLRFCVPRFVDLERKKALSELKKTAPEVTFVMNPFEEMEDG
ncbi:MAG: hypothetical protein JW760_13045 [Spirochaetales bacterium]|nr:hypothetical protein [Spirochaetales bacterium]